MDWVGMHWRHVTMYPASEINGMDQQSARDRLCALYLGGACAPNAAASHIFRPAHADFRMGMPKSSAEIRLEATKAAKCAKFAAGVDKTASKRLTFNATQWKIITSFLNTNSDWTPFSNWSQRYKTLIVSFLYLERYLCKFSRYGFIYF
jgi:hypothetical protein